MNILALDTSMEFASIALRIGSCTAAVSFDGKGSLSEKLSPAAHDLLAQEGVELDELDAVVVGKGPGSYTGLRVSMVFGSVIAWVLGADFYAVPSLLAAGLHVLHAHTGPAVVVATANAYHSEIYMRAVRRLDGNAFNPGEDEIVPTSNFRKKLKKLSLDAGVPVTVLGFGCETLLADGRLPDDVVAVENKPSVGAEAVLLTLDTLGHEGFRSRPAAVSPLYLRSSAAELQREKK